MSDNLETRRYVISGRVQGVGFRWFVEREAAQLGITGWVRNCENGDVEVMATGTREQLSDATRQVGARSASRAGRSCSRIQGAVSGGEIIPHRRSLVTHAAATGAQLRTT